MDNNPKSTKIAIFKNKKIRRTIYRNEWWFVITDVAAALAPSGRFVATLFLADGEGHDDRPTRQARGRSFPDRPPYHLSEQALRARAAAAGLSVEVVEELGHPSGQRLVVLRLLSAGE